MTRINTDLTAASVALCLLLSFSPQAHGDNPPVSGGMTDGPAWHAGDHHIHSRYSVGWNKETSPPTPIVAGDAIYPIGMNAAMARYYGLSWVVATDHGGPMHSKVNFELAYPELVQSRKVVPEVVQFAGMELNTPGADHSSLIMAHTADEAERLRDLESRFDRIEPWPADASWNDEARMLEALRVMKGFPEPPVVIANHPSRSATDVGVYGITSPAELRNWNDTAPGIAIGMAGAPGHQAKTIERDGSRRDAHRGSYGRSPTLGGFDQMTARVGGFWDGMLGEGRHWWITANSDSHVNWREGGSDFWPGEYSKTYVWAEKTHAGILEGLRQGHIFVTTGDLISELYVSVTVDGADAHEASIGSTLPVRSGADVLVTIRFRDPGNANSHGDRPRVSRVDLITGVVTGRVADTNSSTRVVARFDGDTWQSEAEYHTVTHRLRDLQANTYLRVRGTNGSELEPEPDARGESPWDDLWFYSNPIFLEVQ
jgi:hypothetical protein